MEAGLSFVGFLTRRPRAKTSGDQLFIACISAEILMVAKLEKVSDTAYGNMIWSLCRIAPQV